jgi:hypothetical protein
MKQEEAARATRTEPAKTGSTRTGSAKTGAPIGGLAGWLLGRLRVVRRAPARLAVLERITLAPRQSLSLIEAEGRRFLVATSPEGTPAFYALDIADPALAGPNTAKPARQAGASQSLSWSRTAGRKSVRDVADRDLRVSW